MPPHPIVKIPATSGTFCWFELTTRAAMDGARFYEQLAGLAPQPLPGPGGGTPYQILMKDGEPIGGVMPMEGPQWPADLPSHWVPYVVVEDVDMIHREAVRLGGRACVAPMDIPIGRFSVLNDPSGAVFTAFKAAPGKTDGQNPMGDGAMVWCELGVPDPATVLPFYERLLGWRGVEVSVEKWRYQRMHCAAGSAVASIYRRDETPGGARPHWIPYLCVPEVGAATEKARSLGATVHFTATEIPGMGRFAGITDPTGADVHLFEPRGGLPVQA